MFQVSARFEGQDPFTHEGGNAFPFQHPDERIYSDWIVVFRSDEESAEAVARHLEGLSACVECVVAKIITAS